MRVVCRSKFIFGILLILSLSNVLAQAKKIKHVHTDSVLNWYDIRDLGIRGKGWYELGQDFEGLPAKAKSMVPESVWNLSHDTAGLNVQFATYAKEIHARWSLIDSVLGIPHMHATRVS